MVRTQWTRGRVEGNKNKRQMEQDLEGLTDPDEKFVGCSDCNRKSLENHILWLVLCWDYSGCYMNRRRAMRGRSATRRPKEGDDGIDIDKKCREGEKWLGSGCFGNWSQCWWMWSRNLLMSWKCYVRKRKEPIGLLGMCLEQFSVYVYYLLGWVGWKSNTLFWPCYIWDAY